MLHGCKDWATFAGPGCARRERSHRVVSESPHRLRWRQASSWGRWRSGGPVQLPVCARLARHRLDRMEPGQRTGACRSRRPHRRRVGREADRRCGIRAHHADRARRRVPHRVVGRYRAMRIHDAVTAGLVGRLLGGNADDVVHAWPLASARTLRAAAAARHPGCARGAQHPHGACVRGRGARVRGARPRAASRREPHHERTTTGDRRERVRGRAGAARAERGGRRLVPGSRVRRRQAVASPLRLHGGRAPGPRQRGRPFTAVFLGRGSPRKGLHTALRGMDGIDRGRHGAVPRLRPPRRGLCGDPRAAARSPERGGARRHRRSRCACWHRRMCCCSRPWRRAAPS